MDNVVMFLIISDLFSRLDFFLSQKEILGNMKYTSVKLSQTDSRVKRWSFPNVSVDYLRPHLQGVLVVWRRSSGLVLSNHQHKLKMGAEKPHILARLSALENLIDFCHHQNFQALYEICLPSTNAVICEGIGRTNIEGGSWPWEIWGSRGSPVWEGPGIS